MSVLQSSQESALTSLAILKVNHDQNRDYISNFVPFVAQVIREAPQDEVSLPEVQAGVLATFSLKMPQGALNTILHRACKKGYVQKRQGIYRRDPKKLADLDLGSVRASVARQQLSLLKELAEFATEGYEVDWGVGEAERALLSYLSTRGTAILTAAVDGTAIDAPPPVDHSGLIVNAFVAEASKSNPTAFEFLVTLVKGSMLADVLYLPGTFEDAHRKFGKTEFFLDTAFVLRAIGFSTKEASQPACELIALLGKQNVRLRMFEHNRDEALAVMDYAARALQPGSQLPLSPPAEFLRNDDWQPSDVEEFIANVPKKLSALGIEVVAKPKYVKSLGIDESGLEQTLKEELPDQRPEARRRDVDSLAAITRLRRGEATHGLENCGAVLVSTNGTLVRTGTEFFRKQGGGKGVSPVIHAHDLTWIAWLKLPTAAPDLPRLQIIADSFAALNPSDELWRRYTSEIARLRDQGEVTTEEFHVLRYSIEARRALLTQTLGDPDVFTEGSIPTILAKAREEITAELRRQLSSERAANAEQAKRDQDLINTERAARESESAKRLGLERDIATKETARAAAIARRSDAAAAKISFALFVAAAVGLALGTFVASDVLLPQSWKDSVPSIVTLAIITVALFSIVNGVFGTNLMDLRGRLKAALSPMIARLLRKITSE
jgi:hypothetical protein